VQHITDLKGLGFTQRCGVKHTMRCKCVERIYNENLNFRDMCGCGSEESDSGSGSDNDSGSDAGKQVNNLLTASFNRSTAAEGMLQLQIDLLHP